MPWEIILTIVLTLLPSLGLGGIIVAIFNQYSGKKKEIEQVQRERKEEQYREFLENAVGFFSGWEDRGKKEKFLKELYTHAPLYASGKVIRAANRFVSSLDAKGKLDLRENGTTDKHYRQLVIAIREDMGIWKDDTLEEKDVKVYSL